MHCKGKIRYVNLDGKEIKLKGDISISENQFHTLNCKGTIRSDDIESDVVTLSGEIKVGIIDSKEIVLCGAVNVEKLRSDNVKLSLHKQNSIKEISCDSLSITHSLLPSKEMVESLENMVGLNLQQYIGNKETTIYIDKIVAKNIEIHGCSVNEIVCNDAKIVDCVVEELRCSGSCDIKGNSIIKNKKFS